MTAFALQQPTAALRLLGNLQDMAARHTNAVLEVLGPARQAEAERHYPQQGLLFAGGRWRAYYHCHESTALHPQEHGHFHIFTADGKQDWAHVAGLSIDAEGQPLQWFTVNRWVTDGPWLEWHRLRRQLTIASSGEDDSLAGNWLLNLLLLYRDNLPCLLIRRDQQLQASLPEQSTTDSRENHSVYTLSTRAIDLQSRLERELKQYRGPLSAIFDARTT